jgi:hypothetical protein
MLQQLPVSSARKLQIPTRGLPCAFLEAVQYVDSLEEPGDIADPVLRLAVDSYLLYASSYASRKFPGRVARK